MNEQRNHALPARPAGHDDRNRSWQPGSRLWLAWAALVWERLWPRLWPPVALAASTLILVLLDIPVHLTPWPQAILLTVILAAFLTMLWVALTGMNWPNRTAARRRLERDSGVDHRPLTALEDVQASGLTDPGSRLLWNAHLNRLRRRATRWSLALPRPGLPARDPYGIRIVIGLLMVIALTVGGSDWESRMARNLVPAFAGPTVTPAPTLDVSVSPPGYTGEPPMYLRAERADGGNGPAVAPDRTFAVPEGSTVVARVSGGSQQPVLGIGGDRHAFDGSPDRGYEIERVIDSGSNITVSQGSETLGVWSIRVIPDRPPEIAFAEPPRGTERGALRLSYEAHDDYGIEDVSAVLRLELDAASSLEREPLELDLPLPSRSREFAEAVSFHDLTTHPWAGESVRVRLAATDTAGQTGQSAQALVRLPERTFNHPIAQAIIDQRRILIRDSDRQRDVAHALDGISVQVDRYDGDTVVFLSLRTASRRLLFVENGDTVAIDAVADLLWDTALRLEDGDLSILERELRAAQDALRRALATDASDERISELTDQLESVLDRYLEALAQDAARHMGAHEGQQPTGDESHPSMSQVSPGAFSEMLDQMRELSEGGARDEASQMLSRLQDMLESLQSGEQAAQQQEMMDVLNSLMDELHSLMGDQQALLDDTHELEGRRPDQSGPPGPPDLFGRPDPLEGGDDPFGDRGAPQGEGDDNDGIGTAPTPEELAELARRQEELRRWLGEMMREIGDLTGDIPEEFGEAEQSMRRSSSALEEEDGANALGPQSESLEQMQQGSQAFVDAIMNQMASGGEGALLPGPGAEGSGGLTRDPLGRQLGERGSYAEDPIELPDRDTMERARSILEELRRRAADQSRPALERDYVERLLERF